VYHQCVFATIMVAMPLREAYLLFWFEASKTIPDKKKTIIIELLRSGALMFLFGFIIWNLDNIFCDSWTRVKRGVGWPIAFFMEGRSASFRGIMCCLTQHSGHAWWHIFTVSKIYFRHICLNLSDCWGTGPWKFLFDTGRNLCVHSLHSLLTPTDY
jgi:dihydroceramidase